LLGLYFKAAASLSQPGFILPPVQLLYTNRLLSRWSDFLVVECPHALGEGYSAPPNDKEPRSAAFLVLLKHRVRNLCSARFLAATASGCSQGDGQRPRCPQIAPNTARQMHDKIAHLCRVDGVHYVNDRVVWAKQKVALTNQR